VATYTEKLTQTSFYLLLVDYLIRFQHHRTFPPQKHSLVVLNSRMAQKRHVLIFRIHAAMSNHVFYLDLTMSNTIILYYEPTKKLIFNTTT